MAALGGKAVSYERSTPAGVRQAPLEVQGYLAHQKRGWRFRVRRARRRCMPLSDATCFRVQGLGLRDSVSVFWLQSFGFGLEDEGVMVSGFGLTVQDFEFRVQGCGFRGLSEGVGS